MNKFVKKLIEKLEEEKDWMEVYPCSGAKCPNEIEIVELEKAKKIIAKIAEEHENDNVCKWEKTFEDSIESEYKPLCSEDGFINITGYFDYIFCPYCGKKIVFINRTKNRYKQRSINN